MLRRLLVVLVLAPAALIAGPPADPYAATEVQDLIVLAPNRPILLRLHLFADGKPAADRWAAYLDRLFDFFDRDEDGFLDKEEIQRIFSPTLLRQLFNGNFTVVRDMAPPPLQSLDLNEDGKVSREEFHTYYRRFGAGPVFVVFDSLPPIDDTLSEALFAALDANHDGKLSAAELAAASQNLRQFDIDDDELITPQEILSADLARNQRSLPSRMAVGVQLLSIPKEDGPRRLSQRLRIAKDILARYDRDKDQKLDPEEIALPADLFASLDNNNDGKLDALELLRWVIARPDGEAIVRLRGVHGRPAAASTAEPLGKGAWQRETEHTLTLPSDELHLHLSALSSTIGHINAASARQFYAEQMRSVDVEDRGFVTRREVREQHSPYLQFAFEVADRDEDGQLTRVELDAFADLLGGAGGAETLVTLRGGDRGLFGLLDTDRDGRLSLRELHGAARRLAPFARHGRVALRTIHQQYQIVISQGPPRLGPVESMNPFPVSIAGPRPARGPLWFRKMDRNGDGDVSRREFLGPKAAFDRLDLDKDGLISLEEAERGDREMRKPGKKPPSPIPPWFFPLGSH
jgi:Ca2+-binding EF-hand superfamily protein